MGAVVFAGRLWGVFSSYPNPTRGPSYGYISLFQSCSEAEPDTNENIRDNENRHINPRHTLRDFSRNKRLRAVKLTTLGYKASSALRICLCSHPVGDSSPKARKQVQNPNAVLTYVGAITDQLVDEKIVETVTWTQKDSPCITGIAGEDKIK
ncbi:hypothetical protein AFLA70_212g002112 [Aspergillus flavus AF70]|nr:hypothetical protein AFLA70_212g002112 [Aspergillus flavus AF70]